MTNTTTVEDEFPIGDRWMAIVNVDITSLGAAGTEAWVPETEVPEADDVDAVIVGSHEAEAHRITYDHVNQQFDVVDVAAGGDVAGTTDVGEVEALVLYKR